MFDLLLKLKKKEQPLIFTGIDRAEYEGLIRYFLSKPNLNVLNKSLHESRLNNTMLSSSRSTRTRKNIKSSAGNNDQFIPSIVSRLRNINKTDVLYEFVIKTDW